MGEGANAALRISAHFTDYLVHPGWIATFKKASAATFVLGLPLNSHTLGVATPLLSVPISLPTSSTLAATALIMLPVVAGQAMLPVVL